MVWNIVLTVLAIGLAAISVWLWNRPPDPSRPSGLAPPRSVITPASGKRKPIVISDQRAAKMEREEAQKAHS